MEYFIWESLTNKVTDILSDDERKFIWYMHFSGRKMEGQDEEL
jgi:hypothetical protein